MQHPAANMKKLVGSWRMLFSYVFVVLLAVTSAERQRQRGSLTYQLVEEQPAGTFVADVRRDTGLALNSTSSVAYSLLVASAHFHMHPDTGVLSTSDVIDRDVLCPGQLLCQLPLNVVIQPAMYFLKVTVEIVDLNDNSPTFPRSYSTVYVSEATVPGQLLFPVQSAYDLDSPQYGVVGYRLVEDSSNTFQLSVDNSSAGGFDVRVVLGQSLDRERRSFYQITVAAEDGGRPCRSGTVVVDILITDVNDNNPRFYSDVYNIEITENASPLNNVVVLRASDPDAGVNGEISYSLSARSEQLYGHLLSVHSRTGVVSQLKPIDFEQHREPISVQVEARDRGEGSLPATAHVLITVRDLNEHPPHIRFESTGTGSDVTSVEVLEHGEAGDFVAHMSVEDPDSGNAGRVHCTMPSSHFTLVRMYTNDYKITTGPEVLDRELQARHRLVVICNDMGQPVRSSTAEINVAVRDINDNDPVFSETVYNWTIKENNNVGDVIGRVIATDRDSDDNALVVYRIADDETGSGSDAVRVNSTSGDVTAAKRFDWESTDVVSVRVLAEDSGRPSRTGYSMVSVHIEEEDMDHHHRLAFSQRKFELRVRENSPADTVVGRVTVADRENRRLHDHVSFSLRTSLARRLFRIDSDTGRLYTRGPLDRELRTAYLFIVGVQSASMRSSATAQVKVTVDDVNDCSPTWVFPMSPNNDTVHVNFGFGLDEVPVATLVAKDADDGDNARLSYSMTGWKDATTGESRQAGTAAGFIVDAHTGSVYIRRGDEWRHLRPATTLYVTVQDGGRPSLSTSGQLTVVIDNYDVTAAARWRALATESSFLSLPLGGLQLAIIVAMVTATLLLAALVVVSFVVARKNRKRKYVVNGRGGSGIGDAHAEAATGNSMAVAHGGGGMLVVDDVISCGDSCSYDSDVMQAAGVVGVVPWNYVNDVSDDVMVTSHGVYAAVSQQGVEHQSCVCCHPHHHHHHQKQEQTLSEWSPGRSSLASNVSRPSTLDRRTVRFSGVVDTPQSPRDPQLDESSPSFPPPPPPLAIASFNYATLYSQL